ncbi:ABC transporter permease [Pseudoalteromonas denitrificans]|jgi:putative ABC transport system permease protein|uniref:Putative ABC transport system permease protein n=1 Tax=Pseudoalteromonas denitrificans DSM 6059 TaxID=1123010 RepID=A0A1I1Q6A0_9GAMM|nr:ABC transporter permease [Pseudoalteromonas denitrificans]SFD13650.1 putative ABC transport system permease protein [Pseudoalteromonas denitrificans DSM 6059]
MQQSVDISWWQLAFFMLILSVPFMINRFLNLGLAQEFAISIARMTAQLLLVGLYLEYLFTLNNVFINTIWLLVMLLIGASAILSSTKLTKKHLYLPVLTGLSLSLLPILFILLFLLLQPAPFYSAQYLIPISGMLLGNSLSGNIVALQGLFSAFDDKKSEYETALSLGARPLQAAFPFMQAAFKKALAPILASMTTTGIVTLPGMMTGQILGGINPMTAIKYQLIIIVAIFVMLNVSVATSLYLTLRTVLSHTGLIKVTKSN